MRLGGERIRDKRHFFAEQNIDGLPNQLLLFGIAAEHPENRRLPLMNVLQGGDILFAVEPDLLFARPPCSFFFYLVFRFCFRRAPPSISNASPAMLKSDSLTIS